MLEIKEKNISLYIADFVAKNIFSDPKLNGNMIHVFVDFEKSDGDKVRYFGYDELPADADDYVPAKKPTPDKVNEIS